jgi:hypothetical protein
MRLDIWEWELSCDDACFLNHVNIVVYWLDAKYVACLRGMFLRCGRASIAEN